MVLKVVSVQSIPSSKRESQKSKEGFKKKSPNTFGEILKNMMNSRNI